MHYGGKLFRPVEISGASQTSSDTIFKYEQTGNMVIASYSGGNVKFGQMIGLVNPEGLLKMRYQHIDRDDALKTGICETTPEVLPSGKLRLHEKWEWTCGDHAKGQSVLEEI